MAAFEVGAWVWYNHEVDTWSPAKVKTGGSGKITVRMEDGEQIQDEAASGNFMSMDESNLQSADDMVNLGDLHEAALLHNLRIRFFADDIFTHIGPILVAANPYKRLPIFTPAKIMEYAERVPGQPMAPHVYGTTMDCYRDMLDNKENQSIVISGESGAGKTEETKQAVQFLAHIAKAETEGTGPEQLLLGSSPILEAFGNAKTLKNNNSSRFGKYLEIHFNEKGTIVGGQTIKYLLEKSRIIASIGTGERNYHVFYMLAYLPEDRQEEIKYVGPEGYEYCRKAGCIEVDGIDDQAEFKEMTNAWGQFNMLDTEIMSIYRVVSGVLYLGNVVFEEGADGNSAVENDEVLDPIGELFQAEPEILETTLTMRNMTTAGSIVVIPLTVDKAQEAQAGLAKATYSKLFDWVVQRCALHSIR